MAAQKRKTPPTALYTVPAAAEYLGCSQMHIYRLIAGGELRAVDIAVPGALRTKYRVRADSLSEYIERRTSEHVAAARDLA